MINYCFLVGLCLELWIKGLWLMPLCLAGSDEPFIHTEVSLVDSSGALVRQKA